MELPSGRMASEQRPAGLSAGLVFSSTDPVQKLKAVAEPLLGSPYRTGGAATTGFDCSGLVLTLLRSFGQAIAGRSSPEFWKQGSPVDKARLQAGDLLFFSDHSRSIGHVAMYLSDGKFVHASVGKGVIVSELDEDYYRRRYKGARRLTDFARQLWDSSDSVAATL
jgi:cell wall-associated NlpC family hydrolase